MEDEEAMTCCHCRAVDEQFGPKIAAEDRMRYQRRGPDKTTRIMLEVLRDLGVENAELLDIGAGVGVVSHELLRSGAAAATHVEAAAAYSEAAKAEAAEQGHLERMQFVYGDFMDYADSIRLSDVVTLDRVVCCYPHFKDLLSSSAARCRQFYALSYPRDRWYVRAVVAAQNFRRRLTGNDFRTFVHSEREMDAVLSEAGLALHFDGGTFAWRVAVFR